MKRMKEFYELRSQTYLTRRIPVIMRIDGKAFHTYTKNLDEPFDEGLIEDMQKTAIYLCKSIQGAKCAYVQSDEISILITDYDTLQTDAWFGYNVQKMTSISASLATSKFNQFRQIRNFLDKNNFFKRMLQEDFNIINAKGCFKHKGKVIQKFQQEVGDLVLANFDSRVFNCPKEEVSNYFLARQKDAVKNSISSLSQSLYSHSELNRKNSNQKQEMCFQKGHNWNDLHFSKKRGSFIVKNTYVNDKLAFQEKYEYNIGDIWYQENNNRLLEWAETTDGSVDWCDVKIEKIRSKWEVIETPLTFHHKNFEKWL